MLTYKIYIVSKLFLMDTRSNFKFKLKNISNRNHLPNLVYKFIEAKKKVVVYNNCSLTLHITYLVIQQTHIYVGVIVINLNNTKKREESLFILRSIRHFDATIETGGSPVWIKIPCNVIYLHVFIR